MDREPILQIKDMGYDYDEGVHVLKHISTAIYQGEKIAVVGANGAGKSTFFLCINGVLRPDEGEVYFHGKKMEKEDIKELRRHVGIVFQDADSQIIASTVFTEVAFGPMNLKLSREEVRERTERALNYMNLEDFRDRAPHYMSGGEKKRVSIADIIAMEPEIIIFDEPATGLDPFNQLVLEDVLNRLSGEGKTIILSTHDMDFAYRFADRILVFGDGNILADDIPQNVFADRKLMDQANLKCPAVLEIYRMLMDKGIMEQGGKCPRTIEEFKDLL